MSHADLWGKVCWSEGRAHGRPGTPEEYRGGTAGAEACGCTRRDGMGKGGLDGWESTGRCCASDRSHQI